MPIPLNTRAKASGRSQAAVNAQIAPDELPPIERSAPRYESMSFRPSAVCFVSTAGSSSSRRNVA